MGRNNGYKLLLDAESYDNSPFGSPEKGLEIALTHHLDQPVLSHIGIFLPPGSSTQLPLKATLTSTSSNALQRFTPTERDCYKEQEVDLKFLPRDYGYRLKNDLCFSPPKYDLRYSLSNCLFEAGLEEILGQCGCVPEEFGFEEKSCRGSQLGCMRKIMDKIGEDKRRQTTKHKKESKTTHQDTLVM